MKTVSEALRFGTESLSASTSPALDARLLLQAAAGFDAVKILVEPEASLTKTQLECYTQFLERRKCGEPVAYILGTKEFWGLEFIVTPAVLIPRPETEILVEEALKVCKERPDPLAVLDLGTGSGCIALSLAHEFKKGSRKVRIIATDISAEALAVAKKNAEKFGLGEDVDFLRGDWATGLDSEIRFDLVVSNPPYVASGDTNVSPETVFEPSGALYAPDEGLAEIKKLLNLVPHLLVEPGVFLCEIGSGQMSTIQKLPIGFSEVKFLPDLAGLPRVAKFS